MLELAASVSRGVGVISEHGGGVLSVAFGYSSIGRGMLVFSRGRAKHEEESDECEEKELYDAIHDQL